MSIDHRVVYISIDTSSQTHVLGLFFLEKCSVVPLSGPSLSEHDNNNIKFVASWEQYQFAVFMMMSSSQHIFEIYNSLETAV